MVFLKWRFSDRHQSNNERRSDFQNSKFRFKTPSVYHTVAAVTALNVDYRLNLVKTDCPANGANPMSSSVSRSPIAIDAYELL